jgi:hypothetical protein
MTANVLNTNIVFTETTQFPYYDDFDESKQFHKILFRPGYAVQARELTQLQTILQAQIERFGNHVFRNGSLVLGGQMSVDDGFTHINLASTYVGTDIDPSVFVGGYIQWSANNRARAYVIAAQDATTTEPHVLAIKYVTGRKFGHGDTIKLVNGTDHANIAASSSNGGSVVVSIQDGIFFINGYFVKSPAQSIIASAFSPLANCKIGLAYTPSIVDENDDISLLDPAQESSNYQAPGATRLAIDLVLTTRPLDSDDDESQFIELLKIEAGVIKKWIKYPIYSELGDSLARRTFDESGSYTVSPFRITYKDHPTDDTKLIAVISRGKAYIEGHEFETISDTNLELNRARATININSYDLSCTYGNYFVGQNLAGSFDHTTFALADIHSVPSEYIDRTAQLAYDSTKIGTTRIRSMEYYASTNAANVGDRTYKVSLTGTKFRKLQTNANTIVALTANTVGLWSNALNQTLSANADAYRGASLILTVGTVKNVYRITGWNGGTKVANLVTNIITTPSSTTNAVIAFDIAAAESLTVSSLTSGAPSERANINFSTASKFPATATGDAYLTETNLDSLIFKFPQPYVKAGSLSDQSFAYRKKFSTTFSGLSASIAVDASKESFSGSISGVTSSTLLSNYLVIGSDQSVVALSAVSVDGTQTATLTSVSYNGTATVYAKVNLNAGNNILPKRKTLVTGNTTHFVRHAANGMFIQNGVNTSIYLVAGQTLLVQPTRAQNQPMTLGVSDVKRVSAIYDLGTLPATGALVTGYSDVSTKYIFRDGQTDSFYDHSSISLSPYAGDGPRGPLLVCYDYYDHTVGETDDGLGYFSVDSYPNANTTAGYSAIPSYTAIDGSVLELRDCIDFRPKRTNATNTDPAFTLSGIRIPVINSDFDADYAFYLPRRDLITLTTNENNAFEVISGIAAQYPILPRNKEHSMVLYKILMPAYTESYNDVMSQFVENKRYTMRDIGVLETRIENLEYYETLSRLESAASNAVILDEFGLERTKYGIIVDDFTGHGIGDVLNIDYKCSIDKIDGALGPAWLRKMFVMPVYSSTNVVKTNDFCHLSYEEVPLVSQGSATRTENVQPFMFADFIGNIILSPAVVSDVTTNIAPSVLI